jgi:DNA-binding NarL/FixJ family response regulator
MRPAMIAALLTLYAGRHGEARERLAALCSAARESGDESDIAVALFWLAWLETKSARFAIAIELAHEAEALAVLTGSASARAWALSVRTLVSAHRGEVAETRARAADVAAICGSLDFWQPMLWSATGLGLLELSLGNPDAAWEAVCRLTEQTEAEPIDEPELHQYLPVALEALIALGELARAQRNLDWFAARARALDREWAIAMAARCRALLLAARGDLDAAVRVLAPAAPLFERLHMPFEHARTLLVHGQLQRRRRKKRAARESLQQALTLFEQHGAALWADRARDELERLPAGPSDRLLTAAEQRIVALTTTGLSNKQIAAELFISVHTVELHLSHAYVKLGVHSRSELAYRLRDEYGRP